MQPTARSLYGSFQDSLKAPIHRWFTYPAGYSYKLVEAKVRELGINHGDWIADPFLGSGTTSLAAKLCGVNSVGIEAHPFVNWVAQTKLRFDYDLTTFSQEAERVIATAKAKPASDLTGVWPELIYKCFSDENLEKLYALREAILSLGAKSTNADLLKLALTSALRATTNAGAGWPYIAPSKYAKRVVHRDAIEEFGKQCEIFLSDLTKVQFQNLAASEHRIIEGDARKFGEYCPVNSIDLIVTSPPYLNNYDYADRTRLETYFWGIYDSWGDITRKVRDKLIIAATTQIRLSQMNDIYHCPGIREVNASIHKELQEIIWQLAIARKSKAGKKTYDIMVAGYFEDMLKVLQGAYSVLKPGSRFVLVLGDSAPYGVHVRTEEIMGELAQSVGFACYDIEVIRTRGDKWAHNTQRHKVALRESILTVVK